MNHELILSWIPVLGLCMMRPLGAVLFLPMFASSVLGGSLVRNAIVLLIALPAVPVYLHAPALASLSNVWGFVWMLIVEISIGLMIGFSAAIPFWAIDMAGFVIDTLRGASMANVLNPMLGAQSSVLGILFTQVLAVLFMMNGGFNYLIEAIYQSFVLFPPGELIHLQSGFGAFFSQEWQTTFELCISFAMPAIVAMLLVDVALGFVNRSAKQLNVFFLSMPIKCIMSLLLLIISINFSFTYYMEQISTLQHHASTLLKVLR
ncbi:MAG: type III secretion system export apparatus subunit SctT [Ottowia sp.]|nr:type III secretion system export apparatus subunit SctT [Ottowia sp.]